MRGGWGDCDTLFIVCNYQVGSGGRGLWQLLPCVTGVGTSVKCMLRLHLSDLMSPSIDTQPDKKSAEAQVNNENGMMRYDCLNGLVSEE